MADLRELLEEAGYEDVRTHLQSGNVVLSSTLSPRKLEAQLERQLAKGLGIRRAGAGADARRARQGRRARSAREGGDESAPATSSASSRRRCRPRVARELEAAEIAPARLVVEGRELYAWYPDGVQRSPLAKLLDDKRLGVVSTARNWNTVTKLLELLDD